MFSCLFPAIVFSSDNFDALNGSTSISAVALNADSGSVITLQHLYAPFNDTRSRSFDIYFSSDTAIIFTDSTFINTTDPLDSLEIDSLYLSSGEYFSIIEPSVMSSYFVGDSTNKKLNITISFSPEVQQFYSDTLNIILNNFSTTFKSIIQGYAGEYGYEWNAKAAMTPGRWNTASGVINNKIYIAGGEDLVREDYVLEEYDPLTDQWTTKANIPVQRRMAYGTAVDSLFYLVAGYSQTTTVSRLDVYNPDSNTWTTKSSLPMSLVDMAVIGINNKLYVFGGNNGPTVYSSVYEYDPIIDSWVSKSDMPEPRADAAATVYNGKIWIFGGVTSPYQKLSSVIIYDPVNDSWTTAGPMQQPRNNHNAVIVNDLIYLIGDDGGSTLVEAYSPVLETSI